MMLSTHPQELFVRVTDHLGVKQSAEIYATACRFDFAGSEFSLVAYGAPGLECVNGRMRLEPVSADRESALLVFGMYANVDLSAQLGFPAWFGVAPGESAMHLQFGTLLASLTPERLAHMVQRAASIIPHLKKVTTH